ncbi:MAG: DEAD/DEAH box helicase family protein [Phycisphaerales bacterium]|nr:DEAD/DEAH box helicase family protein [Phycisphaerales bacterium]
MKLQFDSNLDYQLAAIRSIVDIFDGQRLCISNFTVAPLEQEVNNLLYAATQQHDLGIGNRLTILDDELLKNVQNIQIRNGLKPIDTLASLDFSVEMETGTGKTYVYLRTIFELNKKYGFTKFIVVVPSVAIKEGVNKSLEITEDHFKELYDNTPFDYFVYDSQKLGQVRNFATSDGIQIMVINIDAFRKSFDDPGRENKANIIHRPQDRMTGTRPIEFIRATNPIVIIDEPQSVDTTENSKKAISSLNPLCTLRYSATHVDKYNMMYRFDSVDAYVAKRVKQIEVASIQVADGFNRPYIKLLNVDNNNAPITAQIELDVQLKKGDVRRQQKTVRQGDDLLEVSKRRLYEGYIIEDIDCTPGREYISFTSQPESIRLNQAIGEVDQDEYKRLQIRKTIEEHLDKELILRPRGIKVLSLFFIDRVANYRVYDEQGNAQPGKYALMFEEEYASAARKPRFQSLFEGADLTTAAQGVHDGYFAVDKKGNREVLKDSTGEGRTQADEGAYKLIMRDKEKLLSFESKLKFIFSHSALREGWDNPNVFQICTLNETKSAMRKRQEIGRGLRIAVDQQGNRVHGFEVNRLTVMANESFEDFARQLQHEIEQDEGIRFGVVEQHLFANVVVTTDGEKPQYLGVEASAQLCEHLKACGYVDENGKVQDTLRTALTDGTVNLPEGIAAQAPQIINALKKVAGRLNIQNAADRRRVTLNKKVFLGDDFQQLWDRIKYKTTFRVDFDSAALIAKCVREIENMPPVGKARFVFRRGRAMLDHGGVQMNEVETSTHVYTARDYQLPDIVSYLEEQTRLTRKSIVEILRKSQRLDDFKNNPQKFSENIAQIISRVMRLFIVDGIKYEKIGDGFYYAQELFENQELSAYLNDNMIKSDKSVYEQVVYGPDVEHKFAREFEDSKQVKLYAKLPDWFKIPTPLGNYNPDWAVVVELDGQEKLYFVVESKGSIFADAIRPTEQAKIDCGKKHFEALDTGVEFTKADTFDNFMGQVVK